MSTRVKLGVIVVEGGREGGRASKQIPREVWRFKMLYVDNCMASQPHGPGQARLGPVT